jgi:hypothetical protein
MQPVQSRRSRLRSQLQRDGLDPSEFALFHPADPEMAANLAWSRADELATAGRTDSALPRPADYYLGQALRRLEHLDVPPANPA